MGPMSWTREELFFNSQSYFSKLIESINSAQNSIDIECYIFAEGQVLNNLLAAVEQAVKRGVQVRVVMDGFGSYALSMQIFKSKNIAVRIYHPFRLFQLFKYNIRNHKKVFLIDNKIAFIGSHNVFDEALEWLEVGVLLEGPEVDKICFAFEVTWSSACEEGRGSRWFMSNRSAWRRLKSTIIFFNTPWRLRHYSNKLRRDMIQFSENHLWIASPYFIPEKKIIALLRRASRRGVDVRLLLPSRSDVPFTVWVAHYLLPKLLVAGVRVFEYKPCMMHAKVWSVDDESMVGSSNLNHRSYKLDLEIDAMLVFGENKQKLKDWFVESFEKSSELVLNKIPSNWWQSLIVRVLILFRGWM